MLSSLFISNTAWEAGIPAAGAAASWDTDLTHVRTRMCTHTHGHTHTRRRMHEIPAEPSTRRHQTHGLPLSGSKPPRQMKACVEQKHAQPTQSTRARAGAAGWHTCPAVHMARQGPGTGACTHARTRTRVFPHPLPSGCANAAAVVALWWVLLCPKSWSSCVVAVPIARRSGKDALGTKAVLCNK